MRLCATLSPGTCQLPQNLTLKIKGGELKSRNKQPVPYHPATFDSFILVGCNIRCCLTDACMDKLLLSSFKN
ncbi:hypothetical protein HZ326_25903 [Fusarium oxysporum f. sp. albedinis]|nr:hypothetical protein HZ326_25903 [Fusarium oxysporum f. sp. albedinis]